jgi:type VI secretion system protein ImpG
VNAEPVLRAALQDALLMHVRAAWVSAGDGILKPLPGVPFGVGGFDETGDHGWQVLREYQCFAERFNFLELDLAVLLCHLQSGPEPVTLHMAVPGRADSELARTLSRVDASNLLTGCAPAINLFPAAAAPVDVSGRASEYGLAPADSAHVICSVDSVHLLRGRALEVLGSPRTVRNCDTPRGTWAARRALPEEAGPPMRISFASAARAADTVVTASVALTCCDKGVSGEFVDVQPQAALVGAVSHLHEVEGGRALRWRLLAMLALDARPPDLESLRLALSLQDLAASDSARKLQSALVDVRIVPATLPVRHKHGNALIDGTEVRVRLDERAFVGASVAVFVQVMDQYLSHSVHLNSFLQLVAISAESGEELMRCRPRNGNLML